MSEKRVYIPSNLNHYLQEIGKFPVLTRKEEMKYFKRIGKEDQEAKNFVIQCNLKLVVNVAKQYTQYKVSMMDMIQEGNLGLIRAIEKFDYTLGFKFSTYATQWITQYITRFIQERSSTLHLPAHIMEKRNRLRKIKENLTKELQRDPTIEELAKNSNFKVSQVKDLLSYDLNVISMDVTIDDSETCLLDMIMDMTSLSPEKELEASLIKESVINSLKVLNERERDVIIKRYGLFHYTPQTLEEIGQHYQISRERIRQIENSAIRKLASGKSKQILKSIYYDDYEE